VPVGGGGTGEVSPVGLDGWWGVRVNASAVVSPDVVASKGQMSVIEGVLLQGWDAARQTS